MKKNYVVTASRGGQKKYIKSSLNFSDIDDFYQNGLEQGSHTLIMYTNRNLREDLQYIKKAIRENNVEDLQENYQLLFEDTDEAIELIKEMVEVVNDEVAASGLMNPYNDFEA